MGVNDISIILTSVLGTLPRAETVFCALTRRARYQSLKVPFARAAPSAPLFFFYRLFVTIAFLCQRLIAPYHLVYTPYTQEDYSPSLFTFFPAQHSTPAGPETNP